MVFTMTEFREAIVPAEFPELKRLAWNRDPHRPVAAEEAFALYERNWRFVDREHLTDREARLIRELEKAYVGGFSLS